MRSIRGWWGSTSRSFACKNRLEVENPGCRCLSYQVAGIKRKAPDWRSRLGYGVAGAALLGAAYFVPFFDKPQPKSLIANDEEKREDQGASEAGRQTQTDTVLINWSGTHTVRPKELYYPDSVQEVEDLVARKHRERKKLRCSGNGLSPNGLSFSEDGMLGLGMLDKVISIDKENKLVDVQAGALVGNVAGELLQQGLSFENLASIFEQQLGGVTQAGCHGTGATISPIEEQIVEIELVTPALGKVVLSADQPFLPGREREGQEDFSFVKCAFGSLGVVTRLKLRCVAQHKLEEKTSVCSLEELKKQHAERLASTRHVKYLYYPYTNDVIVVESNPYNGEKEGVEGEVSLSALEEMKALLSEVLPEHSSVEQLTFTGYRDLLLSHSPLSVEHVKRINKAEVSFWRGSQVQRYADSNSILGFDCGGEQWVLEVAIPTGTIEEPNGKDLEFVRELLGEINKRRIPAPGPIEQRWTARSTSALSPAFSSNEAEVFSWVGIIMYLPTEDQEMRQKITREFQRYSQVFLELTKKYNGKVHWAKLELPSDPEELESFRQYYHNLLPVSAYNDIRRVVDPHGILANRFVEQLFPQPATEK